MSGEMHRISVIGTSGTGKTTFAADLSQTLGISHIELDALFWGPDWTPLDRDAFRALVEAKVAEQYWIVDGNYSSVRDIVWSQATVVVWLNYSFATAFWRVLKRTVRRIITREQLFAENVETFEKQFLSRESLLWWVITSHFRRRRHYQSLFKSGAYPHLRLIELKSPRHARQFLDLLDRGEARPH